MNEPTELGDDLLPAIDNVNTFDTTLALEAVNLPFNDSGRHLISDLMALGRINDPVFGTTTGDLYFNLSSTVYGQYPFYNRDSILGIDSVVLALAYVGSYGDTARNSSRVTVDVSEINTNNSFFDTVLYRYDHAGFTTGSTLGTASFTPAQFKDTIKVIRARDTMRVTNTLRIPLNNTLGNKLTQFDTATGYKNDSLFRTLFRGLAVKVTGVSGPGVLSYFNLFTTGTALNVYYRYKKDGKIDTATAVYQHATYSQANSIKRNPGTELLANLGTPASPQQLYIQTAPSGTSANIFVPGLTNFPNKIIHRAELIAYKLPSASENIFTAPGRLLLDHKGSTDSAFLFENDILPDGTGSLNLSAFGGVPRFDNSYRFNITRYVQGIVTRREPNDTLRIYAPFRSQLWVRSARQQVNINVLNAIANGRVVLAGATHPNPNLRLRLRIIYSNL